jgi:uncharacterized protein YjbI with pentapeptide repeats
MHTAVTVVCALAVIAALWFFWWHFPFILVSKKHFTDAKQNADVEDAYRKTIGQAIGGAALLVGLYFTMQQYFLATQAQHLDQFQKNFEALKGTDVAVHIGGIYGLEILGETVPEWKTSILMGVSAGAVTFSSGPANAGLSKIPPDAEAALIVVSRAGEPSGEVGYPLARGFFQGAKIPYAKLNGANLENSDLSGSDLYRSRFHQANLAFAALNGANLAGSDLSNARLVRARLCKGNNLAVPDLQRGVAVRAQLRDAKLDNANLEEAWLVEADLRGTKYSGARLVGAHLEAAEMDESTNFQHADLTGANLSYADARKADFSAPAGTGATSDLSQRNILKGANLTNANLAGAKFVLADMTNAHIDGANLTDADLDGAITDGITEAGTHYCRTKWSDGKFRSNDCASDWKMPPHPEVACPGQK